MHFLHSTRQEHRKEVVAILQPRTDAGSNGIDIFEYSTIFDANDILRNRSFHIVICHELCHNPCAILIGATHSEIGQTIERHLFGMTRPTQHHQLVFRHAKSRAEILRTHHIFIRNDAFNGRHDIFIVELYFEFFELRFEIRRRRHENEGIIFACHLVDVAAKVYAINRKFHRSEIRWVVLVASKFLDRVFTTDEPSNFRDTLKYNLCYCSSPRPTTNNGDFPRKLGQTATVFAALAKSEERTETRHKKK